MELLRGIWNGYPTDIAWLLACFVAFGALAKLTPCNPGQPLWRKDTLTDLAYRFVLPLFTRIVQIVMLTIGVRVVFYGQPEEVIMQSLQHGYGPLSSWPIWLQAAIIFIVSDFILYWTHRWFHGKKLWRFHAIHHSPTEIDWLTAYRFHPINIWLSFTLLDVLTILVGFSPEAIGCMATFNMLYSAMVHANLNWTFGPFRYVFASPVFHRWHHTTEKEGLDKNFAPTFPLLDIVFGTFYMPDNRTPQKYGVLGDKIPQGFLAQIIWPLKKKG